MSPDVPFDFTKSEASPPLDPDFQGVILRAATTASHGRMERLLLHGAYRVPVETAREIGAIPLQKALVITITSGRQYWTFNALGGGFAFPDDERGGGGLVQGYFNLDVLQRAGLGAYATCFIVASIGPLLSNVVEVK